MKLEKIAVLLGTTLATLGATSGLAQAATVVNSTIDSYNPQSGDTVLGLCSNLHLCQPGNTISFSLSATTSPTSFIINNDSQFNVTSLTQTIAPNQDAVWGQGVSNIFKNIQISPDDKAITFSGGTHQIGEVALLLEQTIPAAQPVELSITINSGIPVPEPSFTFSLLIGGVLSGAALLRRQF